jgi:energy-coupling factor transport system ATP-binding protein
MARCIEIEALSFIYPGRSEPTLKGINARVNSGEFVLLIGPTGCGKSTLLRTINGLIPHTSGGTLSGRVRINASNVAKQPLSVTSQQVGLLFQNPEDQLFSIVVEDEVAFGLENLNVPPDEIDRRIDSALAQVGLSGFRARPIVSLSSGQKQRVALASLWAMQPQILLLDEPTSYLDSKGAVHLLELVRQLNETAGTTVIIAGHQVNEVAPLCNRVWLMHNGEIVSDLPSDRAFYHLERFRQLGVQAPELAQIAEENGLADRPLTLKDALHCFQNDTNGILPEPFVKVEDRAATDPIRERQRPELRDAHSTNITSTSADGTLIDVQNLTFRYHRRSPEALKCISFQVRRGETIAIMGENGCGKTTLLMLILGLLNPSEGRVVLDGRDAKRYKPHQLAGLAGLVFQNPDLLLQAATVSDEVAFGPKNLKLTSQTVAERLETALQMFDLTNLRTETPYALSQGQRQRTAVAAMFSLHPALLLLDEPTTGQDQFHLHELMDVLSNVMTKRNRTVIFSTHDAHLTLKYADRVLLIHRGELIFDGSPDAAFADPERLERASLIPPLALQLANALKNREGNIRTMRQEECVEA